MPDARTVLGCASGIFNMLNGFLPAILPNGKLTQRRLERGCLPLASIESFGSFRLNRAATKAQSQNAK
jgi:hypothetical protein